MTCGGAGTEVWAAGFGGGACGWAGPQGGKLLKALKSLAPVPLSRALGLLARGVCKAGRGGAGRTGAPGSRPAAPTELPQSPPDHIHIPPDS